MSVFLIVLQMYRQFSINICFSMWTFQNKLGHIISRLLIAWPVTCVSRSFLFCFFNYFTCWFDCLSELCIKDHAYLQFMWVSDCFVTTNNLISLPLKFRLKIRFTFWQIYCRLWLLTIFVSKIFFLRLNIIILDIVNAYRKHITFYS